MVKVSRKDDERVWSGLMGEIWGTARVSPLARLVRSPMRYLHSLHFSCRQALNISNGGSCCEPVDWSRYPAPLPLRVFQDHGLDVEAYPKPAKVAEDAWLGHKTQGFQLYQFPQRI